MAGHADKKRAKEAAEESSRYWLSVTVALVIFFGLRVIACVGYESRSPSFFECVMLLFTLGVLGLAYVWKQDRIVLGVKSSTATDLQIVSLTSIVLGGLHPWGWALWLTVPLYCTYLLVSKLLKWVFTPDEPADGTPEALAFKKKQEKLERKMRSGRYQVVQK